MDSTVPLHGRRPGRRPLLSGPSLTLLSVAALLALHLAFITARYSFDAIAFVGLIHHALYGEFVSMWNEYHILYMPLGYAIGLILLALGWTPDTLVLMQITNALTSGLYLFLFGRLLREQTGSPAISVAFTWLLGVTFAVWYYSTNPEVYPLAIVFLWLTFLSALKTLRGSTPWSAILPGLFAGLALGFHVTSILMVPFVLAALLLDRTGHAARSPRMGRTILFLLAFLLTSLAPYALLYRQVFGTGVVSGIVRLASHAFHQEAWSGQRWLLGTGFRPDLEVLGLLRGVAADPDRPSNLWTAAAWGMRALFLVVVGVGLCRAPAIWKRYRWASLIPAGWLASSFLFFSAMNVGSLKFVSFQLVPALFLCALACSTISRPRAAALAICAMALLLACSNLATTIIPYSRLETNADYQKSIFVRDHTRPEDLVVQMGGGRNIAQKVYLPYIGARRGLVLDLAFRDPALPAPAALQRLSARFEDCWQAGGRVWVFSDVLEDQLLLSEFSERRKVPPEMLRGFFAQYQPQRHARFDDAFGLYLLSPSRHDTPHGSMSP